MNAPLSTVAPAHGANALDDIEIDTETDTEIDLSAGAYRPAHAAHARPAAGTLDLTGEDSPVDVGAEEPDSSTTASRDEPSHSVTVVDDVLTLVTEEPEAPLIGARAAARAARRRRASTAPTAAHDDAAVTWDGSGPAVAHPHAGDLTDDVAPSAGADLRSETAGVTATETIAAGAIADDAATAGAAGDRGDLERDPLALSRAVETAWFTASCWIRRNTTVQIALPCVVAAFVGLVAIIGADGAIRQIGTVLVTAALVTAGVAWVQGVSDQRRRQQDLRFRLASGNLERADLSGTVLDGFTLWGQNLRGAKLSGCSADHVLLSGADLREASMTGASLRVAALSGADMSGARLFRSDLRGADLSGAIAARTSFEDALLRGAMLEGADLTGADLSGADLRGATHDDGTCWAGIVVSDETHLPDGIEQPTP